MTDFVVLLTGGLMLVALQRERQRQRQRRRERIEAALIGSVELVALVCLLALMLV